VAADDTAAPEVVELMTDPEAIGVLIVGDGPVEIAAGVVEDPCANAGRT